MVSCGLFLRGGLGLDQRLQLAASQGSGYTTHRDHLYHTVEAGNPAQWAGEHRRTPLGLRPCKSR